MVICLLICRYVTDATVAIFVAVLLFVLPAKRPKFTCYKQSDSFDLEDPQEGKNKTTGTYKAHPTHHIPSKYCTLTTHREHMGGKLIHIACLF